MSDIRCATSYKSDFFKTSSVENTDLFQYKGSNSVVFNGHIKEILNGVKYCDEYGFGAFSPMLRQNQRVGTKMLPNFLARYKNGNTETRKRGIQNFHLNIRSLRNKIDELKMIVQEHNPHIIGISECELFKGGVNCDERSLKIPGYVMLFPLSWSLHDYARIVVYVRKLLNMNKLKIFNMSMYSQCGLEQALII